MIDFNIRVDPDGTLWAITGDTTCYIFKDLEEIARVFYAMGWIEHKRSMFLSNKNWERVDNGGRRVT